MKLASPKVALLSCLAILIFFSNCIRRPPRREIKPTEFHGRFFVHESGAWKVYEITRDASGRTVEYHVLADNVLSAALSPNGKYLLYYFDPPSGPGVKDNYLVLRDVASGQDKRIISNVDMYGLAWAPDSRTFSYESDHSIFVADLSGNTHVAYQAPHANYKVPGGVGGKEMYAPFGRPKWIAPDRFVFERFAGELPFSQDLRGNEISVEPNKTTVVFTTKPARLVDLDKNWIVRGSCPEQSLLLVGENFRQGQLYLTTVSELAKGKPRPLPADVNTGGPVYGSDITRDDFRGSVFQYVKFTPPNCRLVCLKDQLEKSEITPTSFIDPMTLQPTAGPSLKLHQITQSIFDSSGRYAIMIHNENPLGRLALVNMETGNVMNLETPFSIHANLQSWQLLGWID